MIENVDFPALMLDYAGIALPGIHARALFSIHLRDGQGTGELEAGGLLPLLDAHGPS